MKVFVLIFCIFSCILRKKQHCIDNFILKGRNFPESSSEQPNEDKGSLLNDEKMIKRKISVDFSTNDLESKHKKTCSPQKFLSEDFIENPVEDLRNAQRYDCVDCYLIQNKLNEATKLFLTDQMGKIFVKIEQYIYNNLYKVHVNHYLTKLANIDQSNLFFIKNEYKFKDADLIFDPYHLKFIEIINFMFSNFNSTTEFKKKVCEIFIYKIFDKFFSDEDLMKFLIKLRETCIDYKKIIFYYEFAKCVKYFPLIPELMTLGGVVSECSINDLIIVIHLINLLLDLRKNVTEVKVFIFFLIKRAFTSSYKNRLDLFSIHILQTNCSEGQYDLHNHDLYFFLWEINNHKRGDINKKTKDINILFMNESERNHFRSVLLIFMYQQMIFLRYSNVSYEESKKYVQLINDVIELKNCPICDFSRYLKTFKNY